MKISKIFKPTCCNISKAFSFFDQVSVHETIPLYFENLYNAVYVIYFYDSSLFKFLKVFMVMFCFPLYSKVFINSWLRSVHRKNSRNLRISARDRGFKKMNKSAYIWQTGFFSKSSLKLSELSAHTPLLYFRFGERFLSLKEWTLWDGVVNRTYLFIVIIRFFFFCYPLGRNIQTNR